MKISTIVPAFNEQGTVGEVVSVLRASRVFAGILVVDDGSKDRTAEVARSAGATVLRLPQNSGKGNAMLAGWRLVRPSRPDHVAFYDSDLVGFRTEHVHALVNAGIGCDMACALHDYGPFNGLARFMPIITGDRVLRPWILEALPRNCWSGYRIETAMNRICGAHNGSVRLVLMPGLRYRTKGQKTGFWNAFKANVRMLAEMDKTDTSLLKTGGRSCG